MKDDIVGGKCELEKYVFFPINNCFCNINVGVCERSVYGTPLVEILLCSTTWFMQINCRRYRIDMYSISDGFNLSCCSDIVCDLLDLGPFCRELMYVQQINAKEIFSRVCCVFLSLSNCFLILKLCKKGVMGQLVNSTRSR